MARIAKEKICKEPTCQTTFLSKDGYVVCGKCRYRLKKLSKQCPDCGKNISPSSTRCRICSGRQRMGPDNPNWKGRKFTSKGYVLLSGYYDHPNANKRGEVREHVLVMSESIGRPLRRGEEVHHKNGVKSDNRLSNLELWLVSQPKGQRVEDLVIWAREILETYAALGNLSTHCTQQRQTLSD